MLAATAIPAVVTPMSGTKSSSTRRSSENAKVNVPANVASTAFCSRSRYHSRMYRGDSVPVACCTTSTPIGPLIRSARHCPDDRREHPAGVDPDSSIPQSSPARPRRERTCPTRPEEPAETQHQDAALSN